MCHDPTVTAKRQKDVDITIEDIVSTKTNADSFILKAFVKNI